MRILPSIILFALPAMKAFVANPVLAPSRLASSTTTLFSTTESEAERLLRKARELRAQAEQAENKVHGDLVHKKQERESQTDALIDRLFFSSSSNTLVDRLREKRLGISTLENVLIRLDEREVIARGGDHVVQINTEDGKTKFRKVTKEKNEAELKRLEGLVDELIDAVGVLDKEFLAMKKDKGEAFVAHSEEEHWGGGKCSEILSQRIAVIRRERSEMFQKRMEEFKEAQRLKDDEDHKFKGYTDLGPLN